jgi:tetratricopeptide (TPR) repeat protein
LYYGAALEISSDTHDVVWALTGIASTYGKKKELHKAIHYFEEALRKANNTFPITQIYYQLGKMYFDANYMSKSGQAFRNALKYRNNDPASKNNQEYETDILWHLGIIAYEEDDYDNIVPYLSKVLEKIDDDHYYYANSHLTLGHYYLMIEDYKKARRHYNKVLTAARAANEELKTAKEYLAQTPQHFS